MKKTLVALAALAVVGAASAQSTVTLYGKVTTGVRNITTKVNGVKSAANNVGLQVISSAIGGSRFGFKGSEDLGGGLKANFQLEQGFNSDSGSASLATHQFARMSWVGLSGSWGEFKGGEIGNAVGAVVGNFDANFSYSATSQNFGINTGNFLSIDTIQTAPNMLQYATPNMGGFTATVQFAPGENKVPGTNGAGSLAALQLMYGAGPLQVGFAYESAKGPFAPSTPAVATGNTTKQWVLGASYDLGVAKLTGFVDRGSQSINSAEDKGWHIGAVVPVGSATLNVGFSRETWDNPPGSTITSGKASGLAVHYVYPLSKRTALYGEFHNGKVANSPGNAGQTETKTNRWGFGLRHDF